MWILRLAQDDSCVSGRFVNRPYDIYYLFFIIYYLKMAVQVFPHPALRATLSLERAWGCGL